ncbi:MAG: RnfABCDGE type electron transport complex subunit D [Treponema sp.]|mgnify:CR=1 FL=1|nr:RnfABCDGE type electron transport complex subunit D [Treponema sp.]
MKNSEFDYKIKRTPVLLKPYFFIKPSISAIAIRILAMLFVQILLLAFSKSYQALGVITASTLGAVCCALIGHFVKKDQGFTSIIVIVQGILIGMFLPEGYPVVAVFFLSFFILYIEKIIFSNCVNSWVNVVCVAVIIAWAIGKMYFPECLVTNEFLSVKNPSALMIKNGIFPVYDFDNVITGVLNSTVLYWFKVTLPEGIISLLWDSHSAIPAFRFTLITLFSSVFLFSDRAFSGIIPAVFTIVYGLLIRLVLPLVSSAPLLQGDLILAFCTSGTIFTAIFLLQWFGTKPITIAGKIIYGILAGSIAFLIAGCGYSSVGMCYTVLICNTFNLLIKVIEERQNNKNMSKLLESVEKISQEDEE